MLLHGFRGHRHFMSCGVALCVGMVLSACDSPSPSMPAGDMRAGLDLPVRLQVTSDGAVSLRCTNLSAHQWFVWRLPAVIVPSTAEAATWPVPPWNSPRVLPIYNACSKVTVPDA